MNFVSEKVRQFLLLDNELDRFDYVSMLALTAPGLSSEEKNEQNRIKGCDSDLWCVLEVSDGRRRVRVDSNSLYVKGLALLLADEIECGCKLPPELAGYLSERRIIEEKRAKGLAEIQQKAREFFSI